MINSLNFLQHHIVHTIYKINGSYDDFQEKKKLYLSFVTNIERQFSHLLKIKFIKLD